MTKKQPKLFIIEDDIFISKIYEKKLTKEGFDVNVAHDGKEALSKLEATEPDIILLDLVMPNMDGFGLLEKMKKSKRLQNVPVIVLSNLEQASDIERAMALGAKEYIVKASVSIQDVVDKITENIENS